MLFSVRLLVDGLKKERIFGESLHGFDQNVHQSKAVAVALRLAPLYKFSKKLCKKKRRRNNFIYNVPLNKL